MNGYIIQVEDYGIPFDLTAYANTYGEGLNLGQCYFQEDVLGSGFSDFVCWGTSKAQIRRMVKTLEKKGVPSENIRVFRIANCKL